jgi:D-psicose/D-tagatose/L-ribulose 3-epimerase
MPRPAPLHGVITDASHHEAARAAGVDYVEPSIVGNLVDEAADGTWGPGPAFAAAEGNPALAADASRADAVGGNPVDLADARPALPWPAPSAAMLFPKSLALSDPRVPLDAAEQYLDRALPLIARVAEPGARIVVGSGAARTIPEDVADAAGRARFSEVLALTRSMAREHDLEPVLEPLNRSETNLIHTIEQALAFLDEFADHGLAGMRVVADLFHIMRERESLEVVRRHADRVGQAHVADTDRRSPGQGDWPISEFCAALREGGYTGPISIECNWQDVGAELGPALAALRAADDARLVLTRPTGERSSRGR